MKAHALHELDILALDSRDLETARTRLEEALSIYLETGNEQQLSLTRTHLGGVLLLQGDRERAIAMMEEGLAVARKAGDRASSYVALYSLAQSALSQGDHDTAAPLLEEGVILSGQMRDLANLAYCLGGSPRSPERAERRNARRASAAQRKGCTKPSGCPSTFITSPTAHYTSALPHVPNRASRTSRGREPTGAA